MQDDSTFSGRLKRYAHVSTAMSSAAMRLVGERYFGLSVDHESLAHDLTHALGSLKGPVMKIAQMLASIPDSIPSEYTTKFLQLQANAPAMGWPFVRRRMTAELGQNWQGKFKNFQHEATFAASLGQVHKAESKEGKILACKLQYPDMNSIVEADLTQLKLILSLYEASLKALKTQEIYEEIKARLWEELDYELEAKHIALYQYILGDEPSIRLPEVVPHLSTKRLLTMTWLEGNPLKALLNLSQEDCNRLAQNVFRAWYKPFYHYGVIHGDPHLGNYTFASDGILNLLDFGCVRKFPAPFVKGVIDLYYAMLRQDIDLAVSAYESWGFKNLSKELIEVLNLWAKLLYEPLLEDRVRPIQTDNRGTYGREIAYQVHTKLRELGGVCPPREFVFMDRAAVGIGSVFMHLKAELNWHQLYQELIKDFSIENVEQQQARALSKSHLL
ncbi:ABC transporter ATP-binding protein [Candidatus Paracaedimonas acanthamoebae]|nr:ABC transporter ATP-binding protein [Candidatus Paracaedimonas acanthamoebae]